MDIRIYDDEQYKSHIASVYVHQLDYNELRIMFYQETNKQTKITTKKISNRIMIIMNMNLMMTLDNVMNKNLLLVKIEIDDDDDDDENYYTFIILMCFNECYDYTCTISFIKLKPYDDPCV